VAALLPRHYNQLSAGGAAAFCLEAWMDPETPESPAISAELVALRRDLERRLARIESRLEGLEEMVAALASGRPSYSLGVLRLGGLRRSVPLPPAPSLSHRPLGGTRAESRSGEAPAVSGVQDPRFEQGLDVPTAANWSRPLLLVTGGITLFFFLLLQLFCGGSAPPPRKLPPSKVTPARSAPKAATPPGTLFVTPSSEPEGTEPAAPRPKPPG
jgi:hypothetical protein